MLTKDKKKQYRSIGHKLKPVVTVASKGLSEAVMDELERALCDHELIKVKVSVEDRQTRSEWVQTLCEESKSELVQSIGKTVLIYRATAKPDPRLSNVLRGIAS